MQIVGAGCEVLVAMGRGLFCYSLNFVQGGEVAGAGVARCSLPKGGLFQLYLLLQSHEFSRRGHAKFLVQTRSIKA